MTWLIVFFILIVVAGPILWAMPSKRERRLAAIRQRARELHLMVQLKEIEDPAPSFDRQVSAGGQVLRPMTPCAIYRLAGGERVHRLWVQRRQGAQEPDLPVGWFWKTKPQQVPLQLNDFLEELSPSVLALELDVTSAALYWRESGPEGEVDRIAEWLKRLAAWPL